MRCRHCLHLLQPSTMDAGVFVSVHGARCSNETGHRVAYPWFEVRGSTWHDDVPSMRDLVIHSSAEHSSVWSLTVSNLLDLLEVLTASLSHDPEERSFLTDRLADAMRFLRDSTPYPLPDEEIGHHRREAASRAGITLPVPASGVICGECGCDVPPGPMFVGPWHADPCTFYHEH